jgi:hypothetical protein
MGGFSAQVQQPQASQPQGKGGPGDQTPSQPLPAISSSPQPLDGINNGYFPQAPQPMGKGGNYQHNANSGQPRIGQPNQYPNTVGQWDNAQIQPVQHGKGKGG